jgi:hypothetical protein
VISKGFYIYFCPNRQIIVGFVIKLSDSVPLKTTESLNKSKGAFNTHRNAYSDVEINKDYALVSKALRMGRSCTSSLIVHPISVGDVEMWTCLLSSNEPLLGNGVVPGTAESTCLTFV